MSAFINRNRIHLVVVGGLLTVQVLAGGVTSIYYRFVLRPQLMSAGAQACQGYAPILPAEVPPSCDLVLVTNGGGEQHEIYQTDGGRVEVTITSRQGKLQSTEWSYRANKTSLLLPGLAFLAYVAAILHMIARTGSFTWNFKRQRPDRVEELLLLYAIPVFVSSIVLPLVGR